MAIEYRWAEGHYDRLAALAADLVGQKVDVIATTGGVASAQAAKSATSTIPIVFTGVGPDPVEAGLVASFGRPGSNVTGFSTMGSQLNPKRLSEPGTKRKIFTTRCCVFCAFRGWCQSA